MSKQVKVKFHMLINQDGEEQQVLFDSVGQLDYEVIGEESLMTLTYQEPLMEEDDWVDVKCTLTPNKLTIIRKGKVKGVQKYEVNKQTSGFMIHPYGKLPFHVFTTDLTYNETQIYLKYQLLIQEQAHGQFEMNIAITV